MAWDDAAAADYAADKALNTTRATRILERSRSSFQIPWEEYVTAQNTSSTTYVSVATLTMEIRPDHVGMYLYCLPQGYVTGGGTATFRLDNTTDSQDGSEVTYTAAAYADLSTASKVVLDSSGTLTFDMSLKTTAGTAYIDIEDRLCWWFQVT